MGKTGLFNICMYISRTEKEDESKLMFMPFEIETSCAAAYSHLYKQQMLGLHVTVVCLEQSFICSNRSLAFFKIQAIIEVYNQNSSQPVRYDKRTCYFSDKHE